MSSLSQDHAHMAKHQHSHNTQDQLTQNSCHMDKVHFSTYPSFFSAFCITASL